MIGAVQARADRDEGDLREAQAVRIAGRGQLGLRLGEIEGRDRNPWRCGPGRPSGTMPVAGTISGFDCSATMRRQSIPNSKARRTWTFEKGAFEVLNP